MSDRATSAGDEADLEALAIQYAAAVTSHWTGLPPLASHRLFYNTDETNFASPGVAARVGLRRIGSTLRIK